MMGLRILFSVLAWLVWWGGVIFIIQLDQKARNSEQNQAITKYLLAGVLCGAFVLPVYFWSTRRTATAALRGAAIAFGLALVAFFIAFVGTLIPG